MRALCVLLALTTLCLPLAAAAVTVAFEYPASEDALVNPFIGNAVWASSLSGHAQPFTLVYANVTWAEIEPAQGVFDFAAFEQRNNFDHWKSEGKRLILRFVMDIPGDKKHRDIPDWLADITSGKRYNVSYGRGYCPDYADPVLIDRHARVIAALAQRYDGDGFLAYVEIGSLGHWGEWHVHRDAGNMPPESVRDAYAQAYADAFEHARLMMRRPFNFARDNNIGLFNDTSGEKKPTETWLDWISEGGAYDQTGEQNALSAMPDAWKTAPIGGELTTRVKAERLLTEDIDQTVSLYERSHASWIGPNSFADDVPPGGKLQAAYDRVNRALGYRLRVSDAAIDAGEGGVRVTLAWQNDGVAPFYFDWQPCLRLLYDDGAADVIPLNMQLIDVLPGAGVTVGAAITAQSLPCRVQVGIVDPATGDAGVALAMNAPAQDGWYTLFALRDSPER